MLPLLLVLILVLPLFILAAGSLLAPLIDYLRALIIPPNSDVPQAVLPLILIIKLALFSIFSFTGIVLLLLKMTCLYYQVWSCFLGQPHALHTAYHADQQESVVSLFNWNLFRAYKSLTPLTLWLLVTLLLGSALSWAFTTLNILPMPLFQLGISIGLFIFMVTSFFTLLAFFKAVWLGITTLLGDVVAITEPEKPAQTAFERSRKLAFRSPWGLLLYPLYLVFYLLLATEVVLLLANYDIPTLLTLNPKVLVPVFGLELLTIAVFVLLAALKLMTYHDALSRYYRQLEQARV